MNRSSIITAIAGAVLAGAAGTLGYLYYQEHRQVNLLNGQLHELSEQEKRAVIDRSVSAQMEQIAYEQKAVSDEQREAADEQARIANEMKLQSDLERQHADLARQSALHSEQIAIEASRQAESQRELAETRQAQAELARRAADTLKYQALARSLGSLSSNQWNLGNKELARLLAYAAYHFASRYHADTYQPAIYEALMQASNSSSQWSIGQGIIMKMLPRPNHQNNVVAVTTYGEILSHDTDAFGKKVQVLFKDKSYDFRDFWEDNNNTIYAVSRTGVLLLKGHSTQRVCPIEGAQHPFRIFKWSQDHLLVVAESSLHLFNLKTQQFDQTIPFNFHAQIVGRAADGLLLFGKGATVLKVHNGDCRLSTVRLPFSGQVYSYAYSYKTGEEAFGMTDGSIYLRNTHGTTRKLVGHRSRVSRVSFDDNHLYSTSYDGTVNVWDTSREKADPVRVLTTNRWVISFTSDAQRNHIWTGDQSGNLTRTLINVNMMGRQLKQSLKRNLTPEEWKYYVGENIPYEKFK